MAQAVVDTGLPSVDVLGASRVGLGGRPPPSYQRFLFTARSCVKPFSGVAQEGKVPAATALGLAAGPTATRPSLLRKSST
jgi:hypothetical protein